MDKTRGVCRGIIVVAAIALFMASLTGCTRRFFRKQVDGDVADVLAEKDVFAGWKIENMHVYPDPRARHADMTNPDRPPMPPDDPAARKLGPNPQKAGHAGIARIGGTGYLDLLATWDMENRAERAEQGRGELATGVSTVAFWQDKTKKLDWMAPNPADPLPVVKDNPYLLRIDQAMELGLINSREFQTRREDLYLSALPVTRERFGFAAQYFAIGQAFRERSSSLLTGGSDQGNKYTSAAGLSKLFSTGALLLVAFANQTVIDLTNAPGTHTTSVSTLNLDVLQPLLRGGGRAVTLEPLTQAERGLLYEIRNYARFRKEYFQYLIGGSNLPLTPGATNIGSVASSHPLFGTLVGANVGRQQVVPSGLGAVGGAATAGTLFLGTNSLAVSEGFLPALFKDAIVRYEESNVAALQRLLPEVAEYAEGGLVSSLQVEQVKLQLLQAQSSVLAVKQTRDNALDILKAQLGLPMDVPLKLDDEPAWPITDQLQRYDAILEDYKDAIKQLNGLYESAAPAKMRESLDALVADSRLTKGTAFRTNFPKEWKEWRGLDDKGVADRISKLGEQRRKILDEKTKLELRLEKENKPLTAKEIEFLKTAPAQQKILDNQLATGFLEQALRRYEKAPWLKQKVELQRREKSTQWHRLFNAFLDILEDANKERFDLLRLQWRDSAPVVVDGVDIVQSDPETAYEVVTRTALENRLDLMNTRAQVVDAWRQVRVFANSLMGAFNLHYHMDSSTPPGGAKPLAFQSNLTRHQLIMNFELPIVRLAERNAYRASLIAYQRSRRDLDQKEDEIAAAVRADVRQLQVLQRNLKIQQDAIELAYRQVESSYQIFTAPQDPDAKSTSAANAAALTNQLLGAYRGLPAAQQQLLKTWIDYQIARQQLYLDLELMPLDARGVWIDEYTNSSSHRQPGQLERQRDQPPAPRQGP